MPPAPLQSFLEEARGLEVQTDGEIVLADILAGYSRWEAIVMQVSHQPLCVSI